MSGDSREAFDLHRPYYSTSADPPASVKWPTVTLNIAVRNEEGRLPVLLASVVRQDYPKDLVEVLVIDGDSTDSTVAKAREFQGRIPGLKVIRNPERDPASGRTLGLLNCTAELHLYLDGDMEFADADTLRKLVTPFVEESSVVGTFTRLLSGPKDSPLNDFMSHSPFQHDPVMELLSKRIEDTVVRQTTDYDFCRFRQRSLPVIGQIMFPSRLLKDVYSDIKAKWPGWFWTDLDFPAAIVERGNTEFAFAKSTGIYHHSFTGIGTLLRKKRRDMTWSFLTTVKYRYTTYINYDSKRDITVLFAITVYSLTLAFPIFKGIQKAIRFRDWKCLVYYPFLTWMLTNYLVALILSDRRGRHLVAGFLRTLVGPRATI